MGAIVVVSSMSSAPDLVNRLAPEHLELLLSEPNEMAAAIRHAGSIFLGAHTPEVIGDYVGGPNHVLADQPHRPLRLRPFGPRLH